MSEKKVSTIHLPVDIKYLSAIQAYIRELARSADLTSREITLLNVAVEEAIRNVVEHAFLPEEEAHFDVVCEITPLEFKIIVKDMGLPFSPDSVEEYSPEEDLDIIKKSGLGFRLMKGTIDEVSFHNMGYGGKEVHLVKHRKNKHIDQYLPNSEMKAYKEPEQKPKQEHEKISYHVKLLKSEYAEEISQCAYRTYGYRYIMENIYYPKRLINMSETGKLISGVALTNKGSRVMGHCALERFGYKKDTPELGMAFTKPEYRGQGCMKKLTSFLNNKASTLNIKGIFAKGVTTHPYSQKALLSTGFLDSAVLIGLSPAKNFKKMANSGSQRESLVLCYKKLLETEAVDIYVPEHHKKMIENIYKNLQIEVRIHSETKKIASNSELIQSDIVLDLHDRHGYANIFINDISVNFVQENKQKLRELCQKKIEAINIYLDICKPEIAQYVEELESMNFFFSGIFPSNNKQFLVLQYLNNILIDYEKIVIVSDFAKTLFKYIKELDPNQI